MTAFYSHVPAELKGGVPQKENSLVPCEGRAHQEILVTPNVLKYKRVWYSSIIRCLTTEI